MIPFAVSMLVKATAVSLAALVAARACRRARASARHLVLAAAFATLLALPIASIVAPAVFIPVPIAAAAPVPARVNTIAETETPARETGTAVSSPARPGVPWPSWPFLVAAIWALGALRFLIPVAIGLMQIRVLRRAAKPWPAGQAIANALARDAAIARRAEVTTHDTLSGPVTCGVLHPVILLPADARSWDEGEVRRAVLHELEHVRRADWLIHCATRAIAALYWFHPLVWIAWRELALEAERACDDAVVAQSDATVYADQLVLLAERLSAAPDGHVLAMANRHDLSTRVRAMLDDGQRRGRAGARWVAAAGAASALVVVTMSPIQIVAVAAPASRQPDDVQRFSAVTIKPCTADEAAQPQGPRGRGAGAGNVTASPGSLRIDCMTVQNMIDRAYVFFGEPLLNEYGPPREDTPRVKGGPSWTRTEKYTLEATAGGAADRRALMGPLLRAFLEERLQLRTRRDVEEIPAYALTVAKGGLKIAPIASDAECKPQCGMITRGRTDSMRTIELGGMEREILITVLRLDRHVIDRTGLPESARYNIHLALPDDPQAQPGDPTSPEVFRAVEQQLGLKLEAVKAPHGVIVIEKVVRP